MIYTSTKDGDIDLYIMNLKTGKEVKITNQLRWVMMAVPVQSRWKEKLSGVLHVPKQKPKSKNTKILAEGLVAPTNMEVWV